MATLSLGAIGFAKQTGLSNNSGGTIVPPTPAWFGLAPVDSTALTPNYTGINDGFNRSMRTQILTDMSGKVDVTIYPTTDVIGALLTGAMGGADTVGTVTPYVHTIALATGDINYYTFQRNFAIFPNVYGGTAVYGENFTDCKIDSIAFSGKPKSLITAKVTALVGNVRNAQGGTPAPTTPTFDADNAYTFWNGTLTMVVTGGGQSGTPTAAVTAFDMTFANKSTEVFKFGKILPAAIVPGVRNVAGKLTIVPDSADQYLVPITGIAAGADPSTGLRTGSMTFLLNAITATGAATTHTFQISTPMVGYRTAVIKIDSAGKPVEMTVDFTAQINSGNDEFSAIIKSGTATAY